MLNLIVILSYYYLNISFGNFSDFTHGLACNFVLFHFVFRNPIATIGTCYPLYMLLFGFEFEFFLFMLYSKFFG